MSLTDFFRYLTVDERTAMLATELADAYAFHTGPPKPAPTNAAVSS
jgi:hypothetical protein